LLRRVLGIVGVLSVVLRPWETIEATGGRAQVVVSMPVVVRVAGHREVTSVRVVSCAFMGA
jgi:hypothetical protein